jgi:hypothetical protein
MQQQNIVHLLHLENELPFLFHSRMLIITPSEVDFLLCTNDYPLPNTLFEMNIDQLHLIIAPLLTCMWISM